MRKRFLGILTVLMLAVLTFPALAFADMPHASKTPPPPPQDEVQAVAPMSTKYLSAWGCSIDQRSSNSVLLSGYSESYMPVSKIWVTLAKLDKNGVIDKTIRLYAEQMNIFIPADDLIPKNPQEYEDAGYREMEEALNAVKARVVVNPSLYSGYDRIKARDYANTWTSNTSNYCPHGKALQDTSKWNNTKWPYQFSLCHNDCADYVSQSLNAGGIPVDPGKWERFKDSSNNWAWTYVPGLKNYMLNQKSYWKPSTWESAAAGGVIVIPNSHVMMIVKNDTIERLFSAHTNDRLKYPYAKNTSWEYYIQW